MYGWCCFLAVAVSAAVAANHEVTIDEETFSMSSEPSATSALVQVETEELLGALNLKSLVEDIGLVGNCVRVAYNAIGAAGPRFQKLQNEVQRLGFDISKLCGKSAVTIAMFKTTSRTILVELKATYQFLLDNMEDMAVDTLSMLSDLAGKMATAADELRVEFERHEEKAIDILQRTQLVKGDESIRIEELQRHREEIKAKIKFQEKLVEEHRKLEEEARAERLRFEKKEDKELSAEFGIFRAIGNALTSSFGLGNVFGDKEDSARRASRWGQRSIEKLEIEKQQRQLRHNGLEQLAQFAYEVQDAENLENLADLAVKALHEAGGAMSQLSKVLEQAALFWSQLQRHCKGLADARVHEQIEKLQKNYSDEKRMKYWTSSGFKEKMVRYYAKWVALYQVSTAYLDQIKITQKDLYKYITENPTYEESRKNLKQLVKDFLKDVKNEQEEIQQKNTETDQKILNLKKSSKEEL